MEALFLLGRILYFSPMFINSGIAHFTKTRGRSRWGGNTRPTTPGRGAAGPRAAWAIPRRG